MRQLVERLDRLHAEHVLARQVGGRYFAGVARREQVVQRHKTELARMARRTDDHHAARVEQRAECRIVVARHGLVRASGRRSADVDFVAKLDERIDRHTLAARADDHRVHVDRCDLGPLVRRARHGIDDLPQLVAVHRTLVAELRVDRAGRQRVEHLVHVASRQRRRTHLGVGDRLGTRAACAEHDHRAEHRVAHHTDEQFAPSGNLLRDEQHHLPVVWSRRSKE